jgi:hypothetical protein
MTGLGKPLIICGIILIVFGVIISFAGKIPWLGRLPGDLLIKRDNFTFYFPLATCILVSVLVSLLFWLLKR